MIHSGSRGLGHQVATGKFYQVTCYYQNCGVIKTVSIANFGISYDYQQQYMECCELWSVIIFSYNLTISHHVTCTFAHVDALVDMEKAMKRDKIEVNDRQV